MTFTCDATLLAIDTSSPACSVAVQHNGKISEIFQATARKHTQELLPMIDTLLQERGVNRSDVAGIVISAGPGAFTGLRIGASVAMGLATAWQVPLLPISSLALLAATTRRITGEKTILAMIDARMNEIYVARFEDGEKVARREYVCSPLALPPEWFSHAFVAGSGIVYQEQFPVPFSEISTRLAKEEILPAAQDLFSLIDSATPLPVGAGVELNYLRNEVTQS